MDRGADMKAAFQGEIGSNSHELCVERFADYAPHPCRTFADAFEAVSDGTCEIAVVAMENSAAGRVGDVHALLPRSGLHIVGECFKRVRFDLLACPGVGREAITVVRSHPMALAQCRRIVTELGAVAEPALDTGGAARELAESRAPGVAVLAPPLAGHLHGLTTLAAGVEDEPDNTTRFIVLAREPEPQARPGDGPVLTSLTFATRNAPAALYKALGAFATNDVNVLKLESHLEDAGAFRSALFYAEIVGSPADPAVSQALEELAFFTREYSILGTYPADPARSIALPRERAPSAVPPPRASFQDDAGEDWRATLDRLRHSIDNIDAAVVHLLAERFKVTREVGALKARFHLPPADPGREALQLTRLRRLAEAADLDPSFAEKFLAFVIAEVVAKHRKRQDQ